MTTASPDLYRLMTWLSPSFPVGAFSYSHGLEAAIEEKFITDGGSAEVWIADLMEFGGGFADVVLLVHAHDAASRGDWRALKDAAELALAFLPTAEIALESRAQGQAFLTAVRKAWPCSALDRLALLSDPDCAYPVAVGVAAAGHGIGAAPATAAYLHAFASNLVSAAVRLVPLGQSEGQRIIAALEPLVTSTAHRAHSTPLDGLGTATLIGDICSMRHETQYTRLFRS